MSSRSIGWANRARSRREAGYRPTDPQIAWGLAHFIADIRSVSLDPVLMRANWLEAYDFATRRGAQFLGDYARSADPFANIGERTVAVQVTSVVRASDRSFQVKWTESEYDRGSAAGTSHWTAIITVLVKPPTSTDTLRKNPLGLYVDAIDWSRELEPTAPASPPAPSAPPVHGAFGQRRALVVWQRIILPDGSSLRLDNVPATDTAGYAGLADKVDVHTWSLLKGVALSTLLGVGAELQFSGESDLVQALRQSTQQSVAHAGDQLTSKTLNVQPTITVRPGTPVRLVVHKDLVLAPWRG